MSKKLYKGKVLPEKCKEECDKMFCTCSTRVEKRISEIDSLELLNEEKIPYVYHRYGVMIYPDTEQVYVSLLGGGESFKCKFKGTNKWYLYSRKKFIERFSNKDGSLYSFDKLDPKEKERMQFAQDNVVIMELKEQLEIMMHEYLELYNITQNDAFKKVYLEKSSAVRSLLTPMPSGYEDPVYDHPPVEIPKMDPKEVF